MNNESQNFTFDHSLAMLNNENLAYTQGRKFWLDSIQNILDTSAVCPYLPDTQEYQDWLTGYTDAAADFWLMWYNAGLS